ncbi:MAG: murein biosynthesis integral membrane protein MurJ [Sphingomonadaceae bacterium]
MSLIRAATTVGGFTLLSRVVGLIREMLMARFLGAGFAADAFLVAFRLPNLFRSLFAEGAFSAAFVPMVSARLGDRPDGQRNVAAAVYFTEQALALLLPILLIFTLVVMIAAVPVVWLMTGGFEDRSPEKLELTVLLTRLTFPYLMLISLASLLGGLLNALGRFWVYAAAPIILNLVFIAGFIWFRGDDPVDTAVMQAAAVTIAGILQLLWLVWGCARANALPRLRLPKLTPGMRTLLKRIGPAALGAGATQINLLISTLIAARLLPQGSVAFLYYADRLNQLALGMIGVGMGVALLPTMGRLIGAGNISAAIHQQNRAIEFVLLFAIPAATGLVVAAEPIIAALFQQGEFTASDAANTAAALQVFSLGLPAYMLIKVLTPGFHARGDTRTPMRIGLLAILVNLAGNLLLSQPFAHVGIALATAISAWVNVGLLWWSLHRRGDFAVDAALSRAAPRMLLAGMVMAAAVWMLVEPLLAWASGDALSRIFALAILLSAGAISYFGAGYLVKAYDLKQIVGALKRGKS